MTRGTTKIDVSWFNLRHGVALGLALATFVVGAPASHAEMKSLTIGGFEFSNAITVPGTPEAVFDLFTGDISSWWDHHFVEKPKKLFIDPKPGGGFYEIFDDAGNGALHASVIYADRGKTLRMVGSLGFSGHPLDLVCSLDFEAIEDGGTRVKLTVRAAGEMQEGWGAAVEETWKHFLVEQFKPYAEAKLSR
jgi:hypothetical protein